MTEKELRRLKRSDFLQMLLQQGKDMAALQDRLDESLKELEDMRAEFVLQNAKLDEKDELIKSLIGQLDDKDATIGALQQEIEDMKANRRIELEQAGSIAMAALSLNGVFESAQKAADQYLYNIHLMHDALGAKRKTETPQASDKDSADEAQAPKPKKETPQAEQKTGLFGKLRMRGLR